MQQPASAPPVTDSSVERSRLSAALPWLIFLLAIAFAAIIRGITLDAPFTRIPEGCGCFYGLLARNFLTWNFFKIGGVPVMSAGQLPGVPPTFYGHHPPLLPLLIALTYRLLGQGDWQTRLSTALFTLGCMGLLFGSLKARGQALAGAFAALLFAVMPMTIYYGGQPDVINTQLVFFVFLTILLYLRFSQRPGWGRLGWMCLAFAAAGYTDWPAFYLTPILCAHFVCTHRPRQWGWIVPFGLLAIALFAGEYAQTAVMVQDWHWMAAQVHRRTVSSVSDRKQQITLMSWLHTVAAYNRRLHSPAILLLALGGLVMQVWRRSASSQLLRLLLAFALLHILIGREGVLDHEWWWWPLTPVLAMAGGLFLGWFCMFPRHARSEHNNEMPEVTGSVFAAAALLLMLLGFLNTYRTLGELLDPKAGRGGVGFTTVELGRAIQEAAPDPNSAVMVAYEDAYDLPLWYYGNRPLELGVWDPKTFAARMSDGVADACFFRFDPWEIDDPAYLAMARHNGQVWPRAPVGFVFPREFEKAVPGFVAWLNSHYFRKTDRLFYVYDLTDEIHGATTTTQP